MLSDRRFAKTEPLSSLSPAEAERVAVFTGQRGVPKAPAWFLWVAFAITPHDAPYESGGMRRTARRRVRSLEAGVSAERSSQLDTGNRRVGTRTVLQHRTGAEYDDADTRP
jgi:hypothetical protein